MQTVNSYIPYQSLRVELVREGPVKDYSVKNSEDVYKAMYEEVEGLDRECFWIIPLTAKNKVIGIHLV